MAEVFDPVRHIRNASLILDANQQWPNFHDAEVLNMNIWRGDLRPDDQVYTFPVIDLAFWLEALEKPFRVDLRFHGCESINITDFNYQNPIMELDFAWRDRGFFADGKTPLPRSIEVRITPGFRLGIEFSCFEIEVFSRSPEVTRTDGGGYAIPLHLIGSPRNP
jgi:hypothetical protein